MARDWYGAGGRTYHLLLLGATLMGSPANAEDAFGPPVPATCFSGCRGPGRCSAWDHMGSQDADAALWCQLHVPKHWMVFPSSHVYCWAGTGNFPVLQPKMWLGLKAESRHCSAMPEGTSPTSLL